MYARLPMRHSHHVRHTYLRSTALPTDRDAYFESTAVFPVLLVVEGGPVTLEVRVLDRDRVCPARVCRATGSAPVSCPGRHGQRFP